MKESSSVVKEGNDGWGQFLLSKAGWDVSWHMFRLLVDTMGTVASLNPIPPHFSGPRFLGCGRQIFCLHWLHFKFVGGQLGPLTWLAIKICCCPARPTGVDTMPQFGLAGCLWYPDLVVTQETCQPLSKPYAQGNICLDHISWKCENFAMYPHAQPSLFSWGQKAKLEFLPPQLQNEMGTVLKESDPWLHVQNDFFLGLPSIIKRSEKSAWVLPEKRELGGVWTLIIHSSFFWCIAERDAKVRIKATCNHEKWDLRWFKEEKQELKEQWWL